MDERGILDEQMAQEGALGGMCMVCHGSDGRRRVQVPSEQEPVGSVARGTTIWSNPY